MRVISEYQTPAGQPGYLIECTCRTHKGKTRAIVNAACGEVLRDEHPDRIHGFVMLANSPAGNLARKMSPNHGPWAA